MASARSRCHMGLHRPAVGRAWAFLGVLCGGWPVGRGGESGQGAGQEGGGVGGTGGGGGQRGRGVGGTIWTSARCRLLCRQRECPARCTSLASPASRPPCTLYAHETHLVADRRRPRCMTCRASNATTASFGLPRLRGDGRPRLRPSALHWGRHSRPRAAAAPCHFARRAGERVAADAVRAPELRRCCAGPAVRRMTEGQHRPIGARSSTRARGAASAASTSAASASTSAPWHGHRLRRGAAQRRAQRRTRHGRRH